MCLLLWALAHAVPSTWNTLLPTSLGHGTSLFFGPWFGSLLPRSLALTPLYCVLWHLLVCAFTHLIQVMGISINLLVSAFLLGFPGGSDGKRICLQCGTEKEMAPHSSTLAWKIPWMEEPGGL